MRIHVIHFILHVVVTCGSGIYTEYYDLNKAPQIFMKFMIDYGKVYEDVYDLMSHYDAFVENLILINEANRSNKGSKKILVNEFSDSLLEGLQTLIIERM